MVSRVAAPILQPLGRAGVAQRLLAEDEFLLCVFGFFGVCAASAAATWWTQVVSWLLEHQVLGAAGERSLLAVPASGGAGRDVPLLALAVATLLVVVAGAGAGSAVRQRQRGQQ